MVPVPMTQALAQLAVGCAAFAARIANVGLDQEQLLQQCGDVRVAERSQHLARDLSAERGEAHQGRVPFIGQVKAVGTPIARMRAPLDEAVLDSRSIRRTSEIGWISASWPFRPGSCPLALQPCQHAPLRTRHAVLAGALVDVGPHRAGDIGQLKEDLAPWTRWSFHLVAISRLMMWWHPFRAILLRKQRPEPPIRLQP